MKVQFLGVPNEEQYMDVICASAESALTMLESSEWAKVIKGSISKVRAAGPYGVDVTPSRRGVRITISAWRREPA